MRDGQLVAPGHRQRRAAVEEQDLERPRRRRQLHRPRDAVIAVEGNAAGGGAARSRQALEAGDVEHRHARRQPLAHAWDRLAEHDQACSAAAPSRSWVIRSMSVAWCSTATAKLTPTRRAGSTSGSWIVRS